MGYLIERTAQNLFVTASSVKENGKKRKIVIESRPEFAIVKLAGSRERFPLSWETSTKQITCDWKPRPKSLVGPGKSSPLTRSLRTNPVVCGACPGVSGREMSRSVSLLPAVGRIDRRSPLTVAL